jgi:hypothetical protein
MENKQLLKTVLQEALKFLEEIENISDKLTE